MRFLRDVDFSTRMLEWPHGMTAGFPKETDLRDGGGSCKAFSDLVLEAMHHYSIDILLVTLRPALVHCAAHTLHTGM